MDYRQLHIEKGHVEQLGRHIMKFYDLLDKTTIIDLERVLKDKIKEIDLQIDNYKK